MAERLNTTILLSEKALNRFMRKVLPEPNSGCWLWIGACDSNGYGNLKLSGRVRPAHRVSYEHFVGKIPEGLQIDHLCRVRCCVNPAHMEPVTARMNCQRGDQGRWQKAKTHCAQGHEFTPENTRLKERRGLIERHCIACERLRSRRENMSTENAEKELSRQREAKRTAAAARTEEQKETFRMRDRERYRKRKAKKAIT